MHVRRLDSTVVADISFIVSQATTTLVEKRLEFSTIRQADHGEGFQTQGGYRKARLPRIRFCRARRARPDAPTMYSEEKEAAALAASGWPR
jgi:hypothetical protein